MAGDYVPLSHIFDIILDDLLYCLNSHVLNIVF